MKFFSSKLSMMYFKLVYWLLGLNFSKMRDGMRNQDENNVTHAKK
jgi:hypothetical protein